MVCNVPLAIKIDGKDSLWDIHAKTIQFSGGELHVTIPGIKSDNSLHLIEIRTRIQSSNDVLELMLTVDIVRRNYPNSKLSLVLPYFPYARQDRVTESSGAFSLKIFANLINSLGFYKVTSYDCHSDVTPALVDNLVSVSLHEMLRDNNDFSFFISHKIDALVSPDAGAAKKVATISEYWKIPLIVGSKSRNVRTGELSAPSINVTSCPDNVCIVDDICDGGGTFIALAKVLREKGAKKVSLYVTHGIFSKGFDVFKGLIDEIYTTNSFLIPSMFNPPDMLNVHKVM